MQTGRIIKVNEKNCSRCKKDKSLSEFTPSKTANDGYCQKCKACINYRQRKSFDNTPSMIGRVEPSTQTLINNSWVVNK